jgi:predicted membrane-bound dolichyl-phosphate-mannose-protein mannosyltransferase
MVRKAILPGVIATLLAGAIGTAVGGPDVGVSAALGIAVAVGNFAAAGIALAWAADISLTAVQVVALGGFFVRLGVILGLMFALNTLPWFSPRAFGLAVVPGTVLLLIYESTLVLRGLGQQLVIASKDPAAAAAESSR